MEHSIPFPVNNGIRALKMEVKQNIPGSVPIGGYNAHVTYIGQPILCFVCHEPDHKKEGCPRRKTTLPVSVQSRKLLLSDIVMGRSSQGPSTSKEERTMTRPVERGAPVEDDTDTSSETAEVTNVVTDRTEQPTLETTDRTEDTTAEEVNTDGRNAAPELMETTVIPPESKSASQFGDASLEKATSDILKSVNRHLSLQQQQDLQSPITEEEIRSALEGAPKNTAPGPDGLTYQVYKNHWRLIKEYLIELMNYILDTGSVIDGLSDGVVTLIPKTTNPTTVSEYRPITLLKTDYKLFMKVLANRLKPAFRDIFEIGQTCGVPEKSIIHNLSTIRDTVLYFEEHHNDKGALLSVDFNKAFDRVNHLYLQRVMECFCIPDKIVSVIKNIYRTAHSRIQVNGFFTQRIPIQASVRQGCPLSMFLFELSVEPLIRMAHQNLNSEQRTTCPLFTSRVYADDVLFLLRDTDDCVTLPHILETYSAASCAQLNTRKSFLIPLGSWPDGLTFNESTTVRQAKILGMTVCNSFEEMVEINWTKTTALTRVTLFQQIHRNLNLFERVWHVNIFCFSKLWYLAQILPLPVKYATVLERAVSFYIWKDYLYKLRKAQLVLPKDKGGLQLIAVKEKCQALITPNIIRGQRGESDPMDNEFWKRHIPL
ncbi:hypothetical protein ANN_26355 [Periplaneta americana]|uniref:Reverse transcriptase domain-containing protein n=1 Tax=Periplaneta americana TaxID=6978 RepID=A0ABQ8S676_PERAM|nr:hypothetical protein ANN_26355 [Periplaneta americana]